MTILHERVLLATELDHIQSLDVTITENNKYLLWTQNSGYSMAWIDLSRMTSNKHTNDATKEWVWKHYTDNNMVSGEPISHYIYSSIDDRLYLLTTESEIKIYIIHLPTSTLQCILVANIDHLPCRVFVGQWPLSGHMMLTLYCMDNVLYSYHLDPYIYHETWDCINNASTKHKYTYSNNQIHTYRIAEHCKFAISGWVYRYLPLIVIQGNRAVFYDGHQLCAINLETQTWDVARNDAYQDMAIYHRTTKRTSISSDGKYVFVILYNGTILQYLTNKTMDCVGKYKIEIHPFSKTPQPWPQYMYDEPYNLDRSIIDLHYTNYTVSKPTIIIRPPITDNKYFVSYNDLESMADSKYTPVGVNTWRFLFIGKYLMLYKNKSQYIEPINYISHNTHVIHYISHDKLITFANLNMPLTHSTMSFFPKEYKYLACGVSHDTTPSIINMMSQLPMELIVIICKYITLADVIHSD